MTENAVRRSPRAPSRIGRYALCEVLDTRDDATVHFGRFLDPAGPSRAVAITRLHAHATGDAALREATVTAVRAAARIVHPNLVPQLDVFVAEDETLFVAEYVHGQPLARLLRQARARGEEVPIGVALAVVRDVLRGLHAAHEGKNESGAPLGLVHGELSPEHILVGVDGVARVLDLGIAWARCRAASSIGAHVDRVTSYVAPEQLSHARAQVDRRADVFAAAAVLWELFSGRSPFEGAKALADARARPERPRMYRVDLPDPLEGIVLHGLAPDPEKRFATALQFAAAVEALGQVAQPARVGAWVERLAGDAMRELAAKIRRGDSDTPFAFFSNPSSPPAGPTPGIAPRSPLPQAYGAAPIINVIGDAPDADDDPTIAMIRLSDIERTRTASDEETKIEPVPAALIAQTRRSRPQPPVPTPRAVATPLAIPRTTAPAWQRHLPGLAVAGGCALLTALASVIGMHHPAVARAPVPATDIARAACSTLTGSALDACRRDCLDRWRKTHPGRAPLDGVDCVATPASVRIR